MLIYHGMIGIADLQLMHRWSIENLMPLQHFLKEVQRHLS